jgi:hypothetical protein
MTKTVKRVLKTATKKVVKSKGTLTTLTKTRNKISTGAFGAIAENYVSNKPVFDGTPAQIALAMERAFVVTPRIAHKVLSASDPNDNNEKFDRNRAGSTDLEIERASHIITNIITVPDKIRKDFVTNLDRQTRELTAFLVTEIAPYESSIETALADAGEMIGIITGAQSVSFDLGRAETLLRRLTELKTIDWVCTKYKIPNDIRLMLLNEYMGLGDKKPSTVRQPHSPTPSESGEGFKRALNKLMQAKTSKTRDTKSK